MQKLIKFLTITCFIAFNFKSNSQTAFLSSDNYQEHLIERLQIKTGSLSNHFHSNIKPFEREQLASFLSDIDTLSYLKLNRTDRKNLQFLQIDNWEMLTKPAFDSVYNKKKYLKYLYEARSAFFHVKNEDFDVQINPILQFGYGIASEYQKLPEKRTYITSRGVEMRGRINHKLGFYTMITENLASGPNFLTEYYNKNKGFPYQNLVKVKNDDFKALKVDYFSAIGYIVIKPIKSLTMSFGHDRNFIGSGIRSMILSDFSAPYLQLKSELKLGRMQYLSILGQMTNTQIPNPQNSLLTYPPKYMAFHHLNFNIFKNLNVGLFESVMYGNRDFGFEYNYLNPVIFYRWVEGNIGSSDNAMIGMDFKLNVLKSIGLYGQFMLDEYNSTEFKKEGWWSKKYSWQLGGQYFDFLKIKNLDVQFEHNRARPFMYTHFTYFTNYVNYNTPIAHPLGANFKETLVSIKFQPHSKIFFSSTLMYALKGEDKDTENYGGDILKNNRIGRVNDYNNYIGQGVENKINNANFTIQWAIKHNLFLDISYQFRKDSYSSKTENTFGGTLRLNTPRRMFIF